MSHRQVSRERRQESDGAALTSNPRTPERPTPAGEPPRRAAALRQFADARPHLVWHTLPDGRVDYVSADWCAFTGLSPAASLGDGWQRALHPEDLVRWLAAWDAGKHAGRPCKLEYRLHRADGAYRWFLGHADAVRDAQGRIVAWVGTGTILGSRERRLARPRSRLPRRRRRSANRGG